MMTPKDRSPATWNATVSACQQAQSQTLVLSAGRQTCFRASYGAALLHVPAQKAGHVADQALAQQASPATAQSIDLPAAAASLSAGLEMGSSARMPKRFRSIGTGPAECPFTFAALPSELPCQIDPQADKPLPSLASCQTVFWRRH